MPGRTYDYAIAIPARDEEGRILACLEACRAAMRHAPTRGTIAVLVNNSTDSTADRAMAWARQIDVHLKIKDVNFADSHAHAGSARRAAFDFARQFVAPDGYLLTTDADSQPDRHWIAANLGPLMRGKAALVCGRIDVSEDEHAQLPKLVRERSALEDRYRRAALELDSLLDPDPLNPWPFHGQASGASLAMSLAAYNQVGGAPVVPCAEDRALARRFKYHDLPVLYSNAARVTTSGRLIGRARGGMADTIATRVAGGAHVCDETVEGAAAVWLRARLRARLRAAFCDAKKCQALLSEAGVRMSPRSVTSFGALWALVESASPLLPRRRMHWDEMAAQLPLLESLRDMAARRLASVDPLLRGHMA